MQISCHGARQQHGQGHEAGTDRVVRRLERAVGEVHHVHGVSRETVAIAELVEDDAGADRPDGSGLRKRQEKVHGAGQGQAQGHRQQAAAEAPPGDVPTAQDAACEERNHAGGAVHRPERRLVQAQASVGHRVAEERIQELDRERLRKAVQQQEAHEQADARLREEAPEGLAEFTQDLAACLVAGRPVPVGTRQDEGMVDGHEGQDGGRREEGPGPGLGDGPGPLFQPAGQDDENPLAEHHRDPVERIADAHKGRLPSLVQGEHIIAVRGDVVRGGGESGDDEQDEHPREGRSGRKRRGQDADGDGHQQLHRDDPPALALENVHEGAPERLHEPGKADQAGQQGQPGIVHPEVLEDHHGDRVHDKVRKSFREIQGRYPEPGSARFHRSRVVPG